MGAAGLMVEKLTAILFGLIGLIAAAFAVVFGVRKLQAEIIEDERQAVAAKAERQRASVDSQARIIRQEVEELGDDRQALAAALDE